MKYKLRAECSRDVLNFIQAANDCMSTFNMTRINDPLSNRMPDVAFEFEIDLELSEVIDLLKTIPDSHIMYETVEPIEQYDGERNYKVNKEPNKA